MTIDELTKLEAAATSVLVIGNDPLAEIDALETISALRARIAELEKRNAELVDSIVDACANGECRYWSGQGKSVRHAPNCLAFELSHEENQRAIRITAELNAAPLLLAVAKAADGLIEDETTDNWGALIRARDAIRALEQ